MKFRLCAFSKLSYEFHKWSLITLFCWARPLSCCYFIWKPINQVL